MNVIQPFKKKIMIEAIIKAVMIGVLIAGLVMVGVATLSVTIFDNSNITFIIVGAIIACIAGVAAGIPLGVKFKREKIETLTHRIDSLGLNEGVSTMMEYRKDNSFVARIQREQTQKQLSQIQIKDLKFKISKKLIISIIAIILVVLILLTIPVEALSAITNDTQTDTEEIIEDMFEQLEEVVKDSNLNEEDKEQSQ